MKIKDNIETTYCHEQNPLMYARSRSEITKLVSAMTGELSNLIGARLCVPVDEAVPYEGFVRNLLHPASSICKVVVSNNRVNLLLRGLPPRNFSLDVGNDSSYQSILVRDDHSWIDRPEMVARLLSVLRRHVDDLSVAAVGGRSVIDASKQIKDLITSVSNIAVSSGSLISPSERVAMMRKRKQLLVEVREMLNRVEEVAVLKGSTSHELSNWLIRADKLKYGLRALRRAMPVDLEKLADEVSKLAKTAVSVREHDFDLVSKRSGLTSVQHWRELSGVDLRCKNIVDFLYAFSFVGLGCRVRKCEAAVIGEKTILFVLFVYVLCLCLC